MNFTIKRKQAYTFKPQLLKYTKSNLHAEILEVLSPMTVKLNNIPTHLSKYDILVGYHLPKLKFFLKQK